MARTPVEFDSMRALENLILGVEPVRVAAG
jgi:hypothetical protein